MTILHIHNGDASADVAMQSSVPGEHFAWREALIDGPAPQGFEGAEWRSLRAKHLSAAYGEEVREIENELLAQEEKLASFANYKEVVLWFEHDLFCQIHLIYLLNWFAPRYSGQTKLSLICIGSFPDRESFRGLGELSAEEFGSLFPLVSQSHEGSSILRHGPGMLTAQPIRVTSILSSRVIPLH